MTRPGLEGPGDLIIFLPNNTLSGTLRYVNSCCLLHPQRVHLRTRPTIPKVVQPGLRKCSVPLPAAREGLREWLLQGHLVSDTFPSERPKSMGVLTVHSGEWLGSGYLEDSCVWWGGCTSQISIPPASPRFPWSRCRNATVDKWTMAPPRSAQPSRARSAVFSFGKSFTCYLQPTSRCSSSIGLDF